MRIAGWIGAALLCALNAGVASATSLPGPEGWPPAQRNALAQQIAAAPIGSYAVFDADDTLWQNDIEESLLAYLENRGVLSVAKLDPALRPIPLLPDESLYGYYRRLCDIDNKLCYPWIAQVFAGRTLGELKQRVDAMMHSDASIAVRYRQQGRVVEGTVRPPRIYPAQQRLIGWLRAHGVRVYVVTASAEELVRMVVSDPRYGLNVAAADVIGVTMLLRAPDGSISTARQQIASGEFGDMAAGRSGLMLTPTLWSPLTWYEGKVAGIQAYIDPLRRPLLVAGDSRSDWPMLFYSGGIRLWVDRDAALASELQLQRHARAKAEQTLQLQMPQPADQHWLSASVQALSK